ncbi:hypothetical protein E4U41_006221 [Claviceps citrina]|nr:hypothetical protein E4U41_006221 [Claviceps citrina]
MEARFPISRDDLYNLQMEVKQVQYTQTNHAERLLRLEKRNADDSALKSIPHNDVFDDLDEQGEELLGSLHLGPAEEEPVRRGAASRANSVRFDESALHGSSWGGQLNRHSEDFGPIRPGSGLMMERSLSHKSDGRHSSAGHSIHSHHSMASGRASSLGLDNNYYAAGDDDASSFEIPGPPVSLYVLGTVPSIIRCWLTTSFAHDTLLYADVCTGSQKSVVESSLLKKLDLLEEVERDADGVYRIRLNVYLAEAVVARHGNRNFAPNGAVPSMAVTFEVSGIEPTSSAADHQGIGIYIGSDALRAHSADVLFSQNTMVLYGDEQERLRVPFVRPEDEKLFRNICTTTVIPGKPRLNANATPFVLKGRNGHGQPAESASRGSPPQAAEDHGSGSADQAASLRKQDAAYRKSDERPTTSEHGGELDSSRADVADSENNAKGVPGTSDGLRGGSLTSNGNGIWGSWRHSTGAAPDGTPREAGNLSGYQPAGRSGRNMKVLKPLKSVSSAARAGAASSYESPPPLGKASNNSRRKSQASLNGDGGVSVINRWDVKRSVSSGAELKPQILPRREDQKGVALPRPTNPVGVASAFSWMTPTTKSSAAED